MMRYFVTAILVILSVAVTQAATFNVPSGNTDRLIQAINRANRTAEHDTIRLASGDYNLRRSDGLNGLPSITSPITIHGNGARIQRTNGDEPAFFRLFHVTPEGRLTLDNLTLKGGLLEGDSSSSGAGSAILNRGFLNLNRVTVRDNGRAFFDGNMAIENSGTLVMTHSVVKNNETLDLCGAGLFNNRGTSTIVRSIFEGNYTDTNGGGLCNYGGTVWLLESSVKDNGTDGVGGGIVNWEGGIMHIDSSTVSGNQSGEDYAGSGIYNQGEMTVSNSTVSGNRGGVRSAGISNLERLQLRAVTITENQAVFSDEDAQGAGLNNFDGAITTVEQSIIVGNVLHDYNSSRPIASDCLGNIRSRGFNLFGVGCPTSGGRDQRVSPGQLLLGPLQNNGGPTETHKPRPDSPAINAVPEARCVSPRDQRGKPRPESYDGRCDIGAVEVARLSCEALFGDAPEFLLCGETETTCSFNARTAGGNCNQMCRSLGSRCVGAIDNSGSSCQEIPGGNDTCRTRRQTAICICER